MDEDEDMGSVLFRLDFWNTNSYGPGNALALFESFMDIMPENALSDWPTHEVKSHNLRGPSMNKLVRMPAAPAVYDESKPNGG